MPAAVVPTAPIIPVCALTVTPTRAIAHHEHPRRRDSTRWPISQSRSRARLYLRGPACANDRCRLAGPAPVVGVHLVDDDVGELRVLAEHALQRAGDLGDYLSLLFGRGTVASDEDVDEWHV